MPIDVFSIILGKSTYARCFSYDTKVSLANGTAIPLHKMATSQNDFYGYGIGDNGWIRIIKLLSPRWTGKSELLRVILDSGAEIRCTPDHKFILRTGEWIEAADLRSGESLTALYRGVYRGYEGVYQHITGQMYPTHRLADEYNLNSGFYQVGEKQHRHHIDENKLNNYPTNIRRIDATEHIKYHNAQYYGEDFDPEFHGQLVKKAYDELRTDDKWYQQYRELQSLKAMSFWNEPHYAERREALIRLRKLIWTDPERRQKQRERMLKFYKDNPEALIDTGHRSKLYWSYAGKERRQKQSEIARRNFTKHKFTAYDLEKALSDTGTIRGAARILGCDRSVFRRSEYKKVVENWKSSPHNHKVMVVLPIKGEHDTYCLTSPETGNFALDAGVFVSNCGIVTNFTPMEAGWEGHLTIEISNTTPLPALIYANEGIAQAMFFESAPARVGYGDRDGGGKYQGQKGITMARVQPEYKGGKIA
jgi:dCTP deaminase